MVTPATSVVTLYHYGVWIESNTPIGGVVSIHNVEYLNDEVNYHGFDLTIEEVYNQYLQEKIAEREAAILASEDDSANIGKVAMIPSEEDYEVWQSEFEYDDTGESTHLIGAWVKDDNGQYVPDPAGEYSAIVSYDSFMCCQVILSRWVTRAALCSPCYAGQGDLDNAGDWLTYDLPIGLYGALRENTNPIVALAEVAAQ